MSFSQEWEQRYNHQQHLSVWPWSDLVSFVMRHCRPQGPNFKVLELGCGAGANIPFFQWLNVDYYGVDGSEHIISRLAHQFPALSDRLAVADFTREIPFTEQFDLIVDRASLTHNTTENIRQGIQLIQDRLKPDGHYIGIDWFSTEHSDFGKQGAQVDPFTKRGFEDGPFAGVGNVHFSTQEHIADLFSAFEIIVMDHKRIEQSIPNTGYTLAMWNFVARINVEGK